ncbi:MAG: hypothetical protein KGO48_10385, partial [Alphaproteobacteria bacterium]|nr:hypothetical protein [Alphaproteobacteria bacterium]
MENSVDALVSSGPNQPLQFYFNPPLGGGSKLGAHQRERLRGGDQPQTELQNRNGASTGFLFVRPVA